MRKGFLPVSRQEMLDAGLSKLDFVYINGDAYVDHPSFGAAIITRVLEQHGFTVGIIPQPDWRDPGSVCEFGEPRLGFLVSAGNMDSMVNHYSVSKKRRKTDAYTPGGIMGKRPDYAAVVYSNLIRRTYKKTPIILGGIEASLRRLAHYDYWSDKLKRSVLLDSGADLISYGMGERSIVEIAEALDSGLAVGDITFIDGTVCKVKNREDIYDAVRLPDYKELCEDKLQYARSFYTQYCNTDPFSGKRLFEKYSEHVYVVQNPPAKPLSKEEMDEVYGLPYQRAWHPMYDKGGGIPAFSEVKYSLISNRGCFGGCSFCALTFHQGRIIQTRSRESLVEEAKHMVQDPGFKGYIHDVGGPTANFFHPACKKQLRDGACTKKQCLFPKPCANLDTDHSEYRKLLKELRELPGVKKVFIRSGIRFDYLMADKDGKFFDELCEHHISGQLKVAPEHVSDRVLKMMGKPQNAVFRDFCERYSAWNRRRGKNQFIVPYLMSSHPGCTMEEAVKLAEYLRDIGHQPEQVQDFYPTPSTISTCMYYTGVDPRTMEPVYVPKNPHEKAMQRALMQYKNPANRALVTEALKISGRTDLIGYGKGCLVRPDGAPGRGKNSQSQSQGRGGRKRDDSRSPDQSGRNSRKQDGVRSQRGKNSRGGGSVRRKDGRSKKTNRR